MTDPNEAWRTMRNVIQQTADIHCPFKSFTARKVLPGWLNNGILEHLKERDLFYKAIKKLNDPSKWAELRKMKNNCNKLIRLAKNDYVQSQLQQCSKDTKKFWRVVNRTFGEVKASAHPIIELVDPDSLNPNPEIDCPNFMNDYLVSAAPNLASKLQNILFTSNFASFRCQLRLSCITVDETLKVIAQIDVSKSSAVDGLTSRVLKDAFSAPPLHLAFLFNLSIDSGVFPDLWKCGNLILIPKDGSSNDPSNYRPISL